MENLMYILFGHIIHFPQCHIEEDIVRIRSLKGIKTDQTNFDYRYIFYILCILFFYLDYKQNIYMH